MYEKKVKSILGKNGIMYILCQNGKLYQVVGYQTAKIYEISPTIWKTYAELTITGEKIFLATDSGLYRLDI